MESQKGKDHDTLSQNGTLILYQNLNCIPVQYVKNGISKRERPRHTITKWNFNFIPEFKLYPCSICKKMYIYVDINVDFLLIKIKVNIQVNYHIYVDQVNFPEEWVDKLHGYIQ